MALARIPPALYWRGGLFRVGLAHPRSSSTRAAARAVAVLEDFRAECQKAYCAFSGTVNGQLDAVARYRELFSTPDRRFSVGRGPPGGQQLPGRSTIATLPQDELLDAMSEGGEFEDRRNKALLVMLYHRWEEFFRPRIGQAFGVRKNDVHCVLMGDLRRVRNLIVHDNAVVSRGFSCAFLEQIWGPFAPGELRSTDPMIHSLMEQLNAIRVEIRAEGEGAAAG